MLKSLSIKNIALISNLSIELGRGLNVISGETGAGKSLIIDSLSLLLGERADKGIISHGKDFACVEAVFFVDNKDILDEMENLGLERENDIIISRKITIDGKNDCKVNGSTFTLSMLKRLTSRLMDLHGQFQHQFLLKVSNHIVVLDKFKPEIILPKKKIVEEKYQTVRNIQRELDAFEGSDEKRAEKIEYLKYQIDEIEKADFKSGEEDDLKEFRNFAINQEKILAGINQCLQSFNGESTISQKIADSALSLSSIEQYSTDKFNLKSLAERLENTKYELIDIEQTLQEGLASFEFDPKEIELNNERWFMLLDMKKKYGDSIEKINNYKQDCQDELELLENSTEIIAKLQKQLNCANDELSNACRELSNARKLIAKDFENAIIKELSDLGMKNARFIVNFQDCSPSSIGTDNVEFMLSVNLGEDAKPLSKIISGGEMSRFMLAIKSITASIEGIGTMVFDEIDSGISGRIATVTAEKMCNISTAHQIICVSHLAQIASYSDNSFYIYKTDIDGKTQTFVIPLDEDGKIKEIARLAGGEENSSYALLHAKQMLDNARSYKGLGLNIKN